MACRSSRALTSCSVSSSVVLGRVLVRLARTRGSAAGQAPVHARKAAVTLPRPHSQRTAGTTTETVPSPEIYASARVLRQFRAPHHSARRSPAWARPAEFRSLPLGMRYSQSGLPTDPATVRPAKGQSLIPQRITPATNGQSHGPCTRLLTHLTRSLPPLTRAPHAKPSPEVRADPLAKGNSDPAGCWTKLPSQGRTAACSTPMAATAGCWLMRTHLELGAYASAVPCARGHVWSVAVEWGLRNLADTAELLASELVTNAINACQHLGSFEPPVVRLWPVSDRISLIIHVWDACKEMPVRKDADADDLSGRGLMIIDTLSACGK
jgi:hypothetical protein